ncbi:hypothetical protein HWV62_6279 [Athelia sp. TMB]|nr:hypothetical protein HWV62_6279 [Athelia sp. TMB]
MATFTPNSASSPRKPSAGSLTNLAPYPSLNSNVSSNREALKDELNGRMTFDDSTVLTRLGIDQLSPEFVSACVEALEADGAVTEARITLTSLVRGASKISVKDLEAEEEDKEAGSKVVKVKSRKRERAMYGPMAVLFQKIEDFSWNEKPKEPLRRWSNHSSKTLFKEGNSWSFPKISPDFILSDHEPQRAQASALWHQQSSYAEFKATFAQGPYGSQHVECPRPIVTQAADYARLHLSARPFQLFSICLLVFGSHFCVAIFDREGVVFSPHYDIWKDLGTFVRVIRRLSCDMTSVELGHDPTARLLNIKDLAGLRSNYPNVFEKCPDENCPPVFPTFEVSMGQGNKRWYTQGYPIWSSLSLLGRGTVVWRVLDPDSGKLVVLKSAWRSGGHLAESKIWGSARGKHPGVADFVFGADVIFADLNCTINVDAIRGRPPGAVCSPTLHRLILNSYGTPVWEYTSELELLKGFRAALLGHQWLVSQGILHRDVSAGNILLTPGDPRDGYDGFIMDVELAHLTADEIESELPSGRERVKRGAVMTGTAQFMALEILHAIINKNYNLEHRVQHDVESFGWVLGYAFSRYQASANRAPDVLSESEWRGKVVFHFHEYFGHSKITAIKKNRGGWTTPLAAESLLEAGVMPVPLAQLFRGLEKAINSSNEHIHYGGSPKPPISYEIVFDLQAIRNVIHAGVKEAVVATKE